jgi:tetratricopeptide (TPR) repeat protein
MDCRKTLVLALGLLGAAGCVPQNSVQPASPQPAPPPPVVVEKAKDSPKHPPKNAETCVALGNFFAAGGGQAQQGSAQQEHSYELARQEYQQALAIDPNCLQAYLALGELCTTVSDHNGAVKWYRKGLEKLPREGALCLNLGMCYARHKDWDRAIEAMRRATECDPDNKKYHRTLGFCLARAGQTDQALAAFRKSDGESRAHYHLAEMLHHMNQDVEARQHLQIAVREEEGFGPAQRLLAQLEAREPADPGLTPAGLETPVEDGTPPL